jgi:hypothetical protein
MNDPNAPDDLRADLAALKRVSDRDLPDLKQVMNDIRRREPERVTPLMGWRRRIMAAVQTMKARPALAALAAALVLIGVGMVIPVSYDRVTGHDVSITLSAGFAPEQIASTAKEMKARLGSESVQVEAMEDGGAPRFVFHTTLPERSRADAARKAGAFVKELAGKGYTASLAVSPHKERVTSPAVAYAWNQIIQISVDGKSASALESEIRQRLAESGMPDAQVSVKDSPQGGREISVNMQRQNFGGTPAGQEPPPELVLTKNGAPITGGSTVRIKKMKDQTGATSLVVETSDKGKTATATIPNSEKMSDAELQNAIETQLRQAGLNVRVEVVGGQIKVRPIE